jgi:hypothetical protein
MKMEKIMAAAKTDGEFVVVVAAGANHNQHQEYHPPSHHHSPPECDGVFILLWSFVYATKMNFAAKCLGREAGRTRRINISRNGIFAPYPDDRRCNNTSRMLIRMMQQLTQNYDENVKKINRCNGFHKLTQGGKSK